jgi:hypothetical protein
MLPSLIRWKFVDRTWGREDLELLARFWLSCYDRANLPHRKGQEAHQNLELHLTGFPRSAAQAASDELAQRLSEAGVPVDVSATEPDTLVAKTKPREGTHPPFPGLGIHALASAVFDGLLVEIRFTVADANATEQVPGLVGATLVVVGALRNGTVTVKAVWSDRAFVRDATAWTNPRSWEDELLDAFDRYRGRRSVNRELARDLFTPPQNQDGDWGLIRCLRECLDVPFGRPRLGGLLLRAVMILGPLILCLPMAPRVESGGEWFFLIALIGTPASAAAFLFFSLEFPRLFGAFPKFRESFDRHCRALERYEVVPDAHSAPWREDPVIRKLTIEILEAGFVHAADVTTIPAESANIVHRVFLTPDGITYLVLGCRFAGGSGATRGCVWPAHCCPICQTFFSTGERFETSNEMSVLQTLKRAVPNARTLVVPPTTHPLEMCRAHTSAVKQWVIETGATCLPQETMDRFILWQEDICKEVWRVYRERPYSWRDHLRWYLQLGVSRSGDGN